MERIYKVVVHSNQRPRSSSYWSGIVKVDGARVAAEKAGRKASGFPDPHVVALLRVRPDKKPVKP